SNGFDEAPISFKRRSTATRRFFVSRYFFSISIGMGNGTIANRQSEIGNSLGLSDPAPDFGNRRLLARHQHADAIDTRSQPNQSDDRNDSDSQRQQNLPKQRRLGDDSH